ncbi:MAG: zinc-binding alcohol dehydrogenase [Anaerolineae bacterium]|nr:zinc-binding alcohol dehydrogenase [Anaerolineae bacterium]
MRHEQVKERLKQFKEYFPPRLQELGVQTWHAIELPLGAMLERRSIVEVHRVLYPAAEVADFAQERILGPTADQVLVEVTYSVMSPGTERAQLLGLPGVYKHVRGAAFYPGYSGAGTVIDVGRRVTTFKVGDRVAGRIKHSSRYAVLPDFLFHVPDSVSLEHAAFIELGIIVLQGIRKARIKPGESVLVLGQGLIGQMADRLARMSGGAPVVAVARSKAKAPEATTAGAADRFLTVEELERAGVGDGYDVVIEATGSAHILPFAFSLARAGGRVIGLGTPKGRGEVNLGQADARSGVTFIGAHISGMPLHEQSDGLWTYQGEGELFIDLLARGALSLDALITQRRDPAEAGKVYEALRTGDSRVIGIMFDWRSYAK